MLLSCSNLGRLPLIDARCSRNHDVGYVPGSGSPGCGLGLSEGNIPLVMEELDGACRP
ncbi:hypothetical protein F4779DRAFT_608013 [Xylariaceae sp. FL0662B]|nr:hypothetical protein F4779DRAFT_608013 [Xylariaceae sp. FL0662B]